MTDIYERIAGTIFGDPDLGDTDAYERSSMPAREMAIIADRVDRVTATWALGRLVAALSTDRDTRAACCGISS